jgi:hypothetical protein
VYPKKKDCKTYTQVSQIYPDVYQLRYIRYSYFQLVDALPSLCPAYNHFFGPELGKWWQKDVPVLDPKIPKND